MLDIELKSSSHRSSPHRRFSLATLNLGVSLACLALGWIALVSKFSPLVCELIILALGLSLGVIVGWRRVGRLGARVRAASSFWLGTVLVAVYSGFLASLNQPIMREVNGLDSMVFIFQVVGAVLGFPVFLTIVVFMLRAWTWSAFDQQIHNPTL